MELMSSYLALIEKTLENQLIRLNHPDHPLLFQATKHTLLNPGKRLRPLLTLEATLALGGDPALAIVPASAIEILHTYSLIHDDLPCMDDDDLRRGKPTLHKLYPEGQAVLVGDLLLTLAFEVLSFNTSLPADKTIKLIQILTKKSGGEGMILGQSLDLASEEKEISWKQLSEIHQRKTGDLISASLEFGAVVAGASSQTCKSLSLIGEEIGLSFQIIDDILDVEGEPSLLGKPLYSDAANAKSTSLSLLGLEEAKDYAKRLLLSALGRCEQLGIQDSSLARLLPKLIYRSF